MPPITCATSRSRPKPARSYVSYEPIGCVFAVMPWNFPIWQVFRFLAPALMAGNVALLKHATNVPRCADVIAEMLANAGLPDGVFGVLHIDNDMAAEVIADPRVHAVTLTGSERAGRSVAATAGRNLKKCVLELGGSDPFVVLDDADLDKTIPMAISSRFGNAGQTCIAAKRFIVTEGIADEFVRRFVEAAGKLQVGDPNDPAHHAGADGPRRPARRIARAGARQHRRGRHAADRLRAGAGRQRTIRRRSSTTSRPGCRPTAKSCSARSPASSG